MTICKGAEDVSEDPVGEVFGGIVRRLRDSHGWTQEELAERAEISATYLRVVERGENVPTLPLIWRLVDALEISPGRLIDDVARAR